jgi:formylglycine-generating enzyme required for sulfatase activity
VIALMAFIVAAVYADRTARDVTFIGLEIDRFSTLNAANVVVPLRTQTPGSFEPTLTQIAALNARTPAPPTEAVGIPLLEVPSGCFFMGSTEFSDAEPIAQQCFDAPFWIGQTEVTNAQYAAFIDAGGYADESYWTDGGWAWREWGNIALPRHWTISQFNQPDQPVVGVSWYEAVAYANWLTEQVRRDGAMSPLASTGDHVGSSLQGEFVFRLPTEAEWEYAARGRDSRRYPWGNEPVAANAITAETNPLPQAAAAVGSRPDGRSWVGALDMSGNVWEWVNSAYVPYPYAADGREDISTNVVRVVRGGPWNFNLNNARAAYRNYYDDQPARYSSIGFRLVLSSPIQGVADP